MIPPTSKYTDKLNALLTGHIKHIIHTAAKATECPTGVLHIFNRVTIPIYWRNSQTLPDGKLKMFL